MNIGRNSHLNFSRVEKVVKKAKTVSPATKMSSKIHLINQQLPKFVQVTAPEINDICKKEELILTLNIPINSFERKKFRFKKE